MPIAVYSNIKPTQMHQFLVHVLLSMGEFDNELELLSSGNIKAAFIAAKLINEHDVEQGVMDILRRYTLTQHEEMDQSRSTNVAQATLQ